MDEWTAAVDLARGVLVRQVDEPDRLGVIDGTDCVGYVFVRWRPAGRDAVRVRDLQAVTWQQTLPL